MHHCLKPFFKELPAEKNRGKILFIPGEPTERTQLLFIKETLKAKGYRDEMDNLYHKLLNSLSSNKQRYNCRLYPQIIRTKQGGILSHVRRGT